MLKPPAENVPDTIQLSAAESTQIRSQLERLLSSSQFRTSKRCQSLLQYVVDQALTGSASTLKERTLGVAVFGRTPDYDTNQDPVVRTTAGEIRKKLAQYYQQPEHEGEVKISLLAGSYVPDFAIPEASPSASVQEPGRPPVRRWPKWVVSTGILVALIAWLVSRAQQPSHQLSLLDRFWEPLLQDNEVVMCLGQPAAYNLRSDKAQTDLMAAFEHGHGADDPVLKGKTIPLKDLVPMTDRYLAYGDAVCLARLTSIFDKHKTIYHIRGSAQTSFSELREHPSVFIGAFDNEWTLRFGANLRFSFFKEFNGANSMMEMIRDRQHPTRQDWKLINSWPNWDLPNDYAIISRVYNQSTDHMILMAAGITQFGTMSAGEFLSDAEYFSEAAAKFPKDWDKKNLQIVLRVPVVHGITAHPTVIATHVW